jgi:hypothetical protein
MSFTKRIPSLTQLAPVYAIAVTIVYSWSLLRFSWRLPSFLKYSTSGEIGVTFAYLMVINLLESLVVVFAPIVLSVILPQKWFFDRFITKGVLLVSLWLGYLIYIAGKIVPEMPFPYSLFKWSPVFFLLILIFVLLLGQIKFLSKIVDDVSDRFVVFLYISIPISAISLLVVLIRNIL